jgi:Ca-activated chloride channel family protein
MLGQYDAAIESYERALELRPDWSQAEDNLALALARKRKLAPPESDAGGTGGMLEADEVVLDDSGRVDRSGTETVTEGGEPMSEEEMRAIWLRRVQNDPADFLRARFAWQLQRREREEMDAP